MLIFKAYGVLRVNLFPDLLFFFLLLVNILGASDQIILKEFVGWRVPDNFLVWDKLSDNWGGDSVSFVPLYMRLINQLNFCNFVWGLEVLDYVSMCCGIWGIEHYIKLAGLLCDRAINNLCFGIASKKYSYKSVLLLAPTCKSTAFRREQFIDVKELPKLVPKQQVASWRWQLTKLNKFHLGWDDFHHELVGQGI